MSEIERDASAPKVPATEPQQDGEEHIYLPGLLSDEFGLSRSQANLEIATGKVTIDGEPYDGFSDGMTIPKSKVAGKTIEVKGGVNRTFRVQVPESA